MAAARSRSRADDTKVKPRSDAYVGLLGLSLLTLSAAMLFAFLMWQGISEKPKAVQMAPTGGGARVPPPPMGGPAANPPGGAQMPPGAGNPAPPAPPAQPPAPPKQ